MNDDILQHAYSYHDAGVSVIPLVAKKKIPACKFQDFMERPQRREELPKLFSRADSNIGALCGSVSNNLVVVDIDSREKWAELEAYPAFRKAKANAPVVPTYRGYHLYLRAPEPIATSKCQKFNADICAERHYVVAPPSEVRREHGQLQLYLFSNSETMRPIYAPEANVWADLQAIFGFKSYTDIAKEADTAQKAVFGDSLGIFYGLGRQAMDVLLNPKPQGQRSEAEQAVVLRAVLIGWSFDDIYCLFKQYAANGTKFYEKQRAGYGQRWLHACYKNAQKVLKEQVKPRWYQISWAISALEHDTPFEGRSRFTDAEVIRLLLQIERETGKRPVRVPYRALAERLGRPISVVYDAIKRLQAQGALEVRLNTDSTPMFSIPNRFFDLLAKPNNLTHYLSLERVERDGWGSDEIVGPSGIVAGHDAYRQQGLGHSGSYLVRDLNTLEQREFTLSDLMQKGFSYRYLMKALELLMQCGLVELIGVRKQKQRGRPQKVYRAKHMGFSELDLVAEVAGTKGERRRQKRQYEEERLIYAQYLANKRPIEQNYSETLTDIT